MQMIQEMNVGLSHKLCKPGLLQSFIESIVLDLQTGILIECSEQPCNLGSIPKAKTADNRPKQGVTRIFSLALDETRLSTEFIQELG